MFVSNSIQYFLFQNFPFCGNVCFYGYWFNASKIFLNFYWPLALCVLLSFHLSLEKALAEGSFISLAKPVGNATICNSSHLDACYSECSPGTSSIGITWRYGRNANCQALPLIYRKWISILMISLDNSCRLK